MAVIPYAKGDVSFFDQQNYLVHTNYYLVWLVDILITSLLAFAHTFIPHSHKKMILCSKIILCAQDGFFMQTNLYFFFLKRIFLCAQGDILFAQQNYVVHTIFFLIAPVDILFTSSLAFMHEFISYSHDLVLTGRYHVLQENYLVCTKCFFMHTS